MYCFKKILENDTCLVYFFIYSLYSICTTTFTRSFMPYGFGSLTEGKKGPIITINYKRVVEVWMDPEYKEFFYTREPMARYTELGDIREQLELKERLQCKSFDWFMTHIAYDMLEEFPKLPKVQFAIQFTNSIFFCTVASIFFIDGSKKCLRKCC